MIARLLPLLTAAALAVPLSGCIARGSARISNVIPLDLAEGANMVPHLAPDGRQGLVVEGRGPTAIGSSAPTPVVMAMLPRSEGLRGWDVIGIESETGTRLTSLEGAGRSMVFARAKVGGMPATLLFIAAPDAGDPAARGAARRMTIRTLRLEVDQGPASFDQIGSETTSRRYCSPADAIAVTYRIALPDDQGASDRCRSPAS
jgi:hypothetical protein